MAAKRPLWWLPKQTNQTPYGMMMVVSAMCVVSVWRGDSGGGFWCRQRGGDVDGGSVVMVWMVVVAAGWRGE
nr:hypothetical protein [Tanacetum cinerariifolium]